MTMKALNRELGGKNPHLGCQYVTVATRIAILFLEQEGVWKGGDHKMLSNTYANISLYIYIYMSYTQYIYRYLYTT